MVFEDEKVEVTAFPLKHRVPTTGFLFREKPAELNVRKEALDIYKPLISQVVDIKKGEDLILSDGTVVPNRELTLPPWKTRSYAYCTDTVYDPGIVEIIKGVDLLYHEATFSSGDKDLAAQTLHSTSDQAADIARLPVQVNFCLDISLRVIKTWAFSLKRQRLSSPNSCLVNDGDSLRS